MSFAGLLKQTAQSGFRVFPELKTSPRIIRLLVVSFLLTIFSTASPAQILRPEEIYQKLLPSVVTLRVVNTQGEVYVGTAFLAVDKNIAVTAWHVVADATNVSAKFSDERVVSVDGFIDRDEKHDLALIHLTGSGRPAATLCMATAPVGSRAYVIGAPKGFDFSITDGLISQIQKIHGYNQYQVSCPISGGNSGGPVVNDRGEVIGVTAWTKKDAQNLNFAIPASFVGQMDATHALTPWSELVPDTHSIADHATPDSAKASEPQSDVEDLKNMLNHSAGHHVTITVNDGDDQKKFDVVLPENFAK